MEEDRLSRLWILFSGKDWIQTAYKCYLMQFTFTTVLQWGWSGEGGIFKWCAYGGSTSAAATKCHFV